MDEMKFEGFILRRDLAMKAVKAWKNQDGYEQAAEIIEMLVKDINSFLEESE